MRFEGCIAMVTGAGSGLGAQTARALSAEGAVVVLSDVDGAAAARVAQELPKAWSAALDVSDAAAVQAHVDAICARHGQLDLAVNNAGIAHGLALIEDTDMAAFDAVIAVNLRGAFACLRAQLPVMKAQGSGAIIMLASAAGLAGAGRLAAYAASKHGVVGLARSAADEAGRSGVRINAICPAFTETPMLEGLTTALTERYGAAGARDRLSARMPLGRTAETGEIVQAVLWALDPQNSFLTGAAIPIDGGLTAI